MSEILSTISSIATLIGVIVTVIFATKQKNSLHSEDIEEITNADGSKIKKQKRKFK